MIFCGIYKITSPIGSVYIGQSIDIEHRWRSYSRMNLKTQRLLAKSFFEYGFCNHKFEIIHQLPFDVEQNILNVYEQLYIDLYNQCNVNLLNQQLLVRRYASKGDKVFQYSIEGEFIKEWISASQAARELEFGSSKNIRKVMSGYLKTAHGFIWQDKYVPKLQQYKYRDFTIKIN